MSRYINSVGFKHFKFRAENEKQIFADIRKFASFKRWDLYGFACNSRNIRSFKGLEKNWGIRIKYHREISGRTEYIVIDSINNLYDSTFLKPMIDIIAPYMEQCSMEFLNEECNTIYEVEFDCGLVTVTERRAYDSEGDLMI